MQREAIQRIVIARFGALPAGLADRLNVADDAALSDLLLRSATVTTVEEL